MLEIKLHPNLRQTRTADSVSNSAEVGRVLQISVRLGKVHPVENVENVQADFKIHPLIDSRPFDDTQINPLLTLTAKRIASKIAESALRRGKAIAIDNSVKIIFAKTVYRIFGWADDIRTTEA